MAGIRSCWLFLLSAMLAAGCGLPSGGSEPTKIAGSTMGTGYQVQVADLPEGISREILRRRIEAELERINDQMSSYRAGSEISRFNRYHRLDWFGVSGATAQVVAISLEVSRETQGAFDVTVKPLVDIWGFGSKGGKDGPPTLEEIREGLERIGYRRLQARGYPPALRKSRPDIQVDLGGIAKGFGVDRLSSLLDRLGISGYLVEIGGEIRVRGTKPDGRLWAVGVETPSGSRSGVELVLRMREGAVATSGDYRNFFTVDGRRYSHIIDPTTGRPVEHALASVSVVADTCTLADAWATALMVLGPERGYRLALRKGLAVMFFVRSEGRFKRLTTPGFQELLGKN